MQHFEDCAALTTFYEIWWSECLYSKGYDSVTGFAQGWELLEDGSSILAAAVSVAILALVLRAAGAGLLESRRGRRRASRLLLLRIAGESWGRRSGGRNCCLLSWATV